MFKELETDSKGRKNFGVGKRYTWINEFSKRGLPQVYILLILDKVLKLMTPEMSGVI